MKKSAVNELEDREAIVDPLTELLREGAQRLIQQAVGVELEALLAEHGGRPTEAGTAGIVRNGFLPERELQTGVGPVTVRIPKVRAKTGDPLPQTERPGAAMPERGPPGPSLRSCATSGAVGFGPRLPAAAVTCTGSSADNAESTSSFPSRYCRRQLNT